VLPLIFLLISVNGTTQPGTRTIHGSVTDRRGNLLPGSVVQLKNVVTLEIQSYIVQQDGLFHFKDLNPDIDFVIHAEYRARLSKAQFLSRLDSAKKAAITLVIPVD
jgi:hypothetical protein